MKFDNKFRLITIRGGVALLGVLIFSIIFIITYSKKNDELMTKAVTEQVLSSVDGSIKEFTAVMDDMSVTVDLFANIISDDGMSRDDIFNYLGAIEDTTGATQVVYIDTKLKGYDRNGTKYDFSNVDYLDVFENSDSGFSFTNNDGILQRESFYYYKSIKINGRDAGYIISFINSDVLRQCLSDDEYFYSSFYALVDRKYKVLYSTGIDENSTYLVGNMWENFDKSEKNNATSLNVFMNNRVLQNIAGYYYVSTEKDSRYIVGKMVDGTDWILLCCVRGATIEKKVKDYRVYTNKIQDAFIICLIMVFITYMVIVFVLFYKNKESTRELQGKADTDLLTGLYNKITTERMIAEYIEKNPKGQGVLFLVDVDNFKKVNDTMGHAFGDEVLRNLGMRLKSLFRSTDIIGRIGGDEFVVFLININDLDIIEREARKLERFFRTFEVGEYVKYSVTASLGAAIYSIDGQSFEDLYKNADKALYNAKKNGKKQLAFYMEEEKNFTKSVEEESEES